MYMQKVVPSAAPKMRGKARLRRSGCSSEGTPIWKSWQKTPTGTMRGSPAQRTCGRLGLGLWLGLGLGLGFRVRVRVRVRVG